jgi:hypothetical protein
MHQPTRAKALMLASVGKRLSCDGRDQHPFWCRWMVKEARCNEAQDGA